MAAGWDVPVALPLRAPQLLRHVLSPEAAAAVVAGLSHELLPPPSSSSSSSAACRVRVACTGPGGAYAGMLAAAHHVDMALGMFWAHFVHAGTESDPLQGDGGPPAEYYLSQVAFAVGGETDAPPPAACLAPHLPPVPAALAAGFSEANLWASPRATHSSPHYDADDNVLLVLAGRKRVYLRSPADYDGMYSHPLTSSDSNHTALDLAAAARRGVDAGVLVLDAGPGDAVTIPEGWWHQVESEPGTVAVNYWCTGAAAALAASPQAPYLARCLLEGLLHERVSAQREAWCAACAAAIAAAGLDLATADAATLLHALLRDGATTGEPGGVSVSLPDALLCTLPPDAVLALLDACLPDGAEAAGDAADVVALAAMLARCADATLEVLVCRWATVSPAHEAFFARLWAALTPGFGWGHLVAAQSRVRDAALAHVLRSLVAGTVE